MKSTCKRLIATLMAVAMVFCWVAAEPYLVSALGENLIRVSGNNRYETANEIARRGWPDSASTVVLASGTSYPDALAGTPLAYALDAPILLVTGDKVSDSVMNQIRSLSATKIVILGGTAAVSAGIESSLTDMNYTVERIWGSNRYDTSIEIAKRLSELAEKPTETFVVSGQNYPDALAVGPIASLLGAPIIYSDKDGKLNPAVTQYLSMNDIASAYIVGGTSAIGENVTHNLYLCGIDSVSRFSGENRYETGMQVVRNFLDVFVNSDVAFATGENYPDALAGGVFAAKMGIPLILTKDSLVAPAPASFMQASAAGNSDSFIESVVQLLAHLESENVYVLGGTSALSDATIKSYLLAAEAVEPEELVYVYKIHSTIREVKEDYFDYEGNYDVYDYKNFGKTVGGVSIIWNLTTSDGSNVTVPLSYNSSGSFSYYVTSDTNNPYPYSFADEQHYTISKSGYETGHWYRYNYDNPITVFFDSKYIPENAIIETVYAPIGILLE